jgi:pterin-4a-carbinolamine dehydratase
MATDQHRPTSITVHEWRREGRAFVRELEFRDFDQALGFIEEIARSAADHLRRPDMCIHDFKHVRLTVASRRRDGLTMAEVRLMQKVDAVVEQLTPHSSRAPVRAAPRRCAVPATSRTANGSLQPSINAR